MCLIQANLVLLLLFIYMYNLFIYMYNRLVIGVSIVLKFSGSCTFIYGASIWLYMVVCVNLQVITYVNEFLYISFFRIT